MRHILGEWQRSARPWTEPFPMIMCLCLGGVAGIVIGWFSNVASSGLDATSGLSVPFAPAFLVGYRINMRLTQQASRSTLRRSGAEVLSRGV